MMKGLVLIVTLFILGGCAHEQTIKEVDNSDISELGVVIIDYHGEHVRMSINGKNLFDEVIYSQRGGSGISASTVTMTTPDLLIEFCVDGECLQKKLKRSTSENYLGVYRKGPIALHPPMIELSAELEGLD